ncbi:3729_t:CDS:2, partial [Scutellospora calospora]
DTSGTTSTIMYTHILDRDTCRAACPPCSCYSVQRRIKFKQELIVDFPHSAAFDGYIIVKYLFRMEKKVTIMTQGTDLKNSTKNTKAISAEAKAIGLTNGNAKSVSSSHSNPIFGSRRLSGSPVPLNDDSTNASVKIAKKAAKTSSVTKSTSTKSSQNLNSSPKRASRVMSTMTDASKTSSTAPFKSRTLPLPTKNGSKVSPLSPESFTIDPFSMILDDKMQKISSSNTSSEIDGIFPTVHPSSPALKSVNVKNTIATLEKKVTQGGSLPASTSEISTTPTSFTDTNLEYMDMEQLEQLFLNGTRSPSNVSNYSSNTPLKLDIPFDLSDVSWKDDVNIDSDTHKMSIETSYHFTDPDEQLRKGLSMIQEAYNRKSFSVSASLCDGEKGKRNKNKSEIDKLNQKIRELSEALIKEEKEKNMLLISKNTITDRYNKLWNEHRNCVNKLAGIGTSNNIITVINSGKQEIQNYLKTLEPDERQAQLAEFLECCHPHDIHAQQAILEHYVKTTFDVVGTLPNELATKILSLLSAENLCCAREVSRRWREMVNEPNLWKAKCLSATQDDPVTLTYPSDPKQWEEIYHGLHYREHNWVLGNVQSVKFLKGHTANVTAMKLKKTTLVTGSYDETVRIWDMRNGRCVKTLQGKAVSCVDFVLELRMVAAGFNEQGVHVWHMDSGEVLLTLSAHNRGIKSLSMNKKYIVTAGHDMSVIVWDLKEGVKLHTFRGFGNMLLGIQLLGDNNLITTNSDGWIRTYALEEKLQIHQYKIPDNSHIQWFCASGMEITCSTTRTVYKLRWQNKYIKTGKKTEGVDEIIIEPDLSTDPVIKQKITSEAEIFCGIADSSKDRVIFSTRFNSRTHNNKSIYVYSQEKGINRFGGLWESMADQMTTNNMGPISMDVDHEKIVIGSVGGIVYILGFVGDME